jgi:hypothetical protein
MIGLPKSMLPSLMSQLLFILEGGVTSNSLVEELGNLSFLLVELGKGDVFSSSNVLISHAGVVKTSFDFGRGRALF